MKKPVCMFCGAPATLLCDGIIGWDADEDEHGHMTKCRAMFTCDAPVCQKLHEAGEHIRVAEHRKHSALPQPCLTKEQAAIIRASHWAGFANSYTRSIEILKGGGQQTFDF